jgi:cysteine desulfurase
MTPVYLDWCATAPELPESAEARRVAALKAWGNPASPHAIGRRAREQLERARDSVARLLGGSATELVFTSGATEANNLALRSLCADARLLVTSRLEHASVARVAESLAKGGARVHWLGVSPGGTVGPDEIEQVLREAHGGSGHAVVAVQAANHETGVVQPVADVAAVARRHGALLHVDAAQALGKLTREAWSDADTVAVSAHKIGGPKGIGALLGRTCGTLRPLLLGGEQELGLRPGTQCAALAAGFGAAADWAANAPSRYAALRPLRDRLEHALVRAGCAPNGCEPRLPNVLNVSMPGVRGDEVAVALDTRGLCVASGSACSSGAAEISPVVSAMVGEARARSAVRASLGPSTTPEQVEWAVEVWLETLRGAAVGMDEALLEVGR